MSNTHEQPAQAGQVERRVRTGDTMQIWEQAQPLDGWNMTKDGIPEPGTEIEILHFGNTHEEQIFDTATVDMWGICPHAKDGWHGKRSTVTHWRHVSSNTALNEPCKVEVK